MTSDAAPRLRVFTFGPAWGLPTVGPFGLKLEACLRLLEVPYDRVYEDNARKGPKRKTPWVVDGATRMGDTELILDHLERTRGVALDRDLDPKTKARAHLLRRALEEHYHQVFEYELLVHPLGAPHFLALVEKAGPKLFAPLVTALVRHTARKHLFERGIARHSPTEIEAMGRADVDAIVDWLGDAPWFLGDAPTKTDAIAFGLLAVSIKSPLPTPVCSYARSKPNLVRFVDRALARFFPETRDSPASG